MPLLWTGTPLCKWFYMHVTDWDHPDRLLCSHRETEITKCNPWALFAHCWWAAVAINCPVQGQAMLVVSVGYCRTGICTGRSQETLQIWEPVSFVLSKGHRTIFTCWLDSLAFHRYLYLLDEYPIEKVGWGSTYQDNDGCLLPGKMKPLWLKWSVSLR